MALIVSVDGFTPEVHPTAWVAPNATLVGRVKIEAKASVYYGSVLRGDINEIVLGEGSNIQDNCVVHTEADSPTIIGKYVGVGHNAVIHCAKVGDGALIGMGAVLLANAVIGDGAFVAAGALVREGQEIPAHHLAVGVPAKDRGPMDEETAARVKANAYEYLDITESNRTGTIM